MVDINLLGDDQTPFEGEENEKEFQENYESDLNEPTSSSYISSGHIDDSDYAKMMGRGGSKKIIYILAASSIILLVVVAYFIYQSGKGGKTVPSYQPMTSGSEAQPPVSEDTSTTFNMQPEENVITTPPLAPALREKVVKYRQGIRTVNNILNTIPTNVNFTMISYNDGKFLLEFLAGSDGEINNVNSQLKQNLYSAEINLLSKENRNIQNRRFRQALFNGNVAISQDIADAGLVEPTYLSAPELESQLTNICQQVGLKIRQFDTGVNKSEGEFQILPIKFKAIGPKESIISFLQQLLNANYNINFSKISLIASETDLTNPNITLVLNIGLYSKF